MKKLMLAAGLALVMSHAAFAAEDDDLPTANSDALEHLSTHSKSASKGKKIRLVFTLDEDGNIEAFKTPGEKTFHADFPLHADNIVKVKSITTFTTSNPKSCFINGGGKAICVEW